MTLSGARGLARLAGNPGCGMLAAMVRSRADDHEVAVLLGLETVADSSPSRRERRRGARFERSLLADRAAGLRRLLEPVTGLEAERWQVHDLGRMQDHGLRLTTTMRLASRGWGRTDGMLLVHPLLGLEHRAGPVVIEPDAVAIHDGTAVPIEIKSFIVTDGVAPQGVLRQARLQAAAGVIGLRNLFGDMGLAEALLVAGTPFGLQPQPAVRETVGAEVEAVMRALEALAAAEQVPDPKELARLADWLPISLHEECASACALAAHCRLRQPEHPSLLGNHLAQDLGLALPRLAALAMGEKPQDGEERRLARRLRGAARQAGWRR